MKEKENKRDKESVLQLYNKVLPELAMLINNNLAPVVPMFHNYSLERQADTWSRNTATSASGEISIEKGNVQQIGLLLRLEGFHRAGTESFDLKKELVFRLEYDHYQVGPTKEIIWLEKQYYQEWTMQEYAEVASQWSEELVDALTQQLERFS